MGDGAEQVVLVGVGDRTAAGAGHCGPAHAVVGIGRHIAVFNQERSFIGKLRSFAIPRGGSLWPPQKESLLV